MKPHRRRWPLAPLLLPILTALAFAIDCGDADQRIALAESGGGGGGGGVQQAAATPQSNDSLNPATSSSSPPCPVSAAGHPSVRRASEGTPHSSCLPLELCVAVGRGVGLAPLASRQSTHGPQHSCRVQCAVGFPSATRDAEGEPHVCTHCKHSSQVEALGLVVARCPAAVPVQTRCRTALPARRLGGFAHPTSSAPHPSSCYQAILYVPPDTPQKWTAVLAQLS
jgi:hypothetical protein